MSTDTTAEPLEEVKPEEARPEHTQVNLSYGGLSSVVPDDGMNRLALFTNLPPTGFVANWVLPMVPATVGALAHQAGMVYERLARAGMPEHLPRVPGSDLGVGTWRTEGTRPT